MECARGPAEDLDEESVVWLCRLGAGEGERQAAERELHARLVRIALAEVRRRSASTPVTGQELDDIAHQAADDAMLAILAKLGSFRGESRFITWAYRFVILEVSSKLGRHYWRNPPAAPDAGQHPDSSRDGWGSRGSRDGWGSRGSRGSWGGWGSRDDCGVARGINAENNFIVENKYSYSVQILRAKPILRAAARRRGCRAPRIHTGLRHGLARPAKRSLTGTRVPEIHR